MAKESKLCDAQDLVRLRLQDGILVPENSALDGRGATPRRPSTLVFLDILDVVTRENRPVSDNSRASNYAPRLFAKRPEREGYTKQDFERAMESLFSDREILVQEYGRSGDLRHQIVRNQPSAQTAQAAD